MNNASLDDALAIAAAASRVAMSLFRGALDVEFKADDSPVTRADRAVEAEVRRLISERFPEHGIFGEEQGFDRADSEDLWIVDPIDGTRSFMTGHPLFGFLLAKLHRGETKLSIVALPALGEFYDAERGRGARLGGARIRASDRRVAGDAVLYISEAEKIWRDAPEVFTRLLDFGRTRRFAYDCYPYALLASGHVDAVVDYDLQPYDYVPVALLVEEAGGVMTDWQGRRLAMQANVPVIAAATVELHHALLDTIRG
ncbi:Inositol-1-monophosphatase [Defluviimonas aquaemixtae]|uniref:Inositol-1-monophosphatase n=1 Tax=Albidovulum aquaemixtae TaxID=1542388 RepID=A0A2R8B6A5_9RHOB|nr:inositol monophosphatase family protein [Defluviimonas aquaemixtae]SPH18127.1 Inositol-1-monophosphatase [Defluviimonas aquaemixtae]